MVVKKCCVARCKSKSTRKEDARVTYHKFPKDVSVRNTWVRVTRHSRDVEPNKYVCSRHFLLTDFHHYQDRYVLKSGAVPTVFPWTNMDELDSSPSTEDRGINKRNFSTSSRESDSENLESIRKFIAKHDNKVKVTKDQNESEIDVVKIDIDEYSADSSVASNKDEPMAIASSVMDLILNESTEKLSKNGESSASTSNDKCTTSVALSVGSKVEARDFAETWYSAEILEVDYDEMEILVRYDSTTKKPEEWISVNSPRLRPMTEVTEIKIKPVVTVTCEKLVKMKPSKANTPEPPQPVKEDDKVENKPKLVFAVGERCLARWRDSRRFVATIQNDLGNGTYAIIFDDGFNWKCSGNRLSKLKSSSQSDSSLDSRACSTPSPIPGAGPSTSTANPMPIFHTHLFDPTRDYLGSKSERREQKRKLNIKEIFNIGQKQRKKEVLVKEKKQKKPKEKKTRVLKKNFKAKLKRNFKKGKKDIPVAIASIIGTVINDIKNAANKKETVEQGEEVKNKEIEVKQQKAPGPTNNEKSKIKKKKSKTSKKKAKRIDNDADNLDTSKLEKRSALNVSDEDTKSAKLSDGEFDTFDDHDVNFSGDQDGKMSLDNIQEEDKLQNFEKLDDVQHEQEMDRIKEAISKLEDGLNRELNAGSSTIKADVNVDAKESTKINEVRVEPPEVPTELNVDSSEEKPEVNQESPEVNVESIPDLPEQQTEPIAFAADVNIEHDVKSPELETVNEIPEKPDEKVEKIEIQPELEPKPSCSKIKKSKKRSKNLLKLVQRIKLLSSEEKAKSVVDIDTKLKNIKLEMKQILMMFEKEVPDSEPPEGEWCCKWKNGEPVGNIVETEPDNRIDVLNKIALPRKTVQVEDKRLPEGWTKLMVRRSLGHSAGKWDVVLVSPENRRLHTRTDMRNYIENNADASLKAYEKALFDFGIHLKVARRRGLVEGERARAPSGRPLSRKRKKMMMKRGAAERKVKKRKLSAQGRYKYKSAPVAGTSDSSMQESSGNISYNNSMLEDGYVYVGSLKVQVIDNLLRCPAEGCFKNFRNNTLIQMHIKHYHRELRKSLGTTPKVLDLAYARTMPTKTETRQRHEPEHKIIKVKIPRLPKRIEEKLDMKEVNIDPRGDTTSPMPVKIPKSDPERIPRSMDSPMMRQYALQANRPVKRPRVLLPVRKPEPVEPPPEPEVIEDIPTYSLDSSQSEPMIAVPPVEVLDFETAISTHTVSKPMEVRRRPEKRKVFATISKAPLSEDEDITMNSDLDTRSSYPGSGTPDSKTMEPRIVVQNIPMSSESIEESAMYMYTETGERVKLERMKREEIINCHCGFREEDGLMVQCELCLCWQHALCHNIQREADVPQKYTCSICLCPRRGRRSQRFLHDQDRMNEGLLPGAAPSQALRRSHCVSANLLHVADALHALRVKYYVATKKNHPKLYLWAKDWDSPEDSTARLATFTQDKPSGYSDLNVATNIMNSKTRPRAEEVSRVDMQIPRVDMQVPRVDLQVPRVDMQVPRVDMQIPRVDMQVPRVDMQVPRVDMQIPRVDMQVPRVDMQVPRVDMQIPRVDIQISRVDMQVPRVDMEVLTEEQEDRFSQNGSLSNHSLLGGLLSSPGGPSLEMPISTSELERLAKSVQEQADSRPAVSAPQPEAAIENGACRERLLRHVQRCQALIDARLDTLEAEIIELESQDPSFEDDETADYFPRTKQTIQMLLRDLQTLQQLGLIT